MTRLLTALTLPLSLWGTNVVEDSDGTFNLLRRSLLQLSMLAQTLYGYKEQKATVSGCVKSVYHDTSTDFQRLPSAGSFIIPACLM